MSSNYNLIVCRSLTYAQRAARALGCSGITAVTVKTPQTIAHSGCSYSVKISENKLGDALIMLKRSGCEYIGVYTLNPDGTGSEVTLP